jgi:hypothetical protein
MLGEVLIWYRMLIQGGAFDRLAGAYKALSKWGGSSSSSGIIAASSVGRCKDSRVAPLPGYFARYYSSSAVSVNLLMALSACNSINPASFAMLFFYMLPVVEKRKPRCPQAR